MSSEDPRDAPVIGACGHPRPARAKFCPECGAAVTLCGNCGIELPPRAKFCIECGMAVSAPVGDKSPASESPVPERAYTPKHLADKILRSRAALEGERKQVTVMFADVTGSMNLAEMLGAEEWHELLDRFFAILADGVHRYEGTVNQYTGDGIMALFGAPLAHEDHAQRACFAALHLQEELTRYATEVKREHGIGFSTRIGINSGEVVVGTIGDDLRMDYTAQGHVVGLAQRMEQLASPDTCYLTEATASLVDGYCELDDLGEFAVKGASEKLKVYRLCGVGKATTRLDASRGRGLTRFVGREADLAVLETALEQAQAGQGQVVGVVAAAGTGKSRLCLEFAERCRSRGLAVNVGQGLAHGKAIPYLPMHQVFRAYFGIEERDDDATVREKLAGRLLLLDESFREVLPVVFEFFHVPDPERPVPRMHPEAKQRQLFAVVRRVAQDPRAGATRVVAIVEDLHWLDAASEEMLAQWVEAMAASSGLMIVNFRPEYRAAWMRHSHYRQVPLAPLGAESIRALVADLLGDDPSIAELCEQVFQRSGGNPFFAEEIVQTLIESGCLEGDRGAYRLTGPLAQVDVPRSVQALLDARIDRLPEREKRFLQAAAVIGKQFEEPLLRRVLERTGDASAGDGLESALATLKAREFIFETALYPAAAYAFKHPLTQEVALGSQLRERRRQAHDAVADAIEEVHADKLDESAALLAHHTAEAGRLLDAARWNARAAQYFAASDFVAAATHWRAVCELVRTIPDEREACRLGAVACFHRLAMVLRLELGEEEARALFDEGGEWARRAGDELWRARMQQAMAVYLANLGRMDEALEHAAEWEGWVRSSVDPDPRSMALWPSLEPLFALGKLEIHRANSMQQVEWTRDHPRWGLREWGMSAYVGALVELGRSEIVIGFPADGRAHLVKVGEISRDLGDPDMGAFAVELLAYGGWLTGDVEWARVAARQAVAQEARLGHSSRLSATLGLVQQLLLEDDPAQARDVLADVDGLRGAALRKFDSRRNLASARTQAALGDLASAREWAESALAIALERDNATEALSAALTLASVLRGIGDEQALARSTRALETAAELVDKTGAKNFEPLLLAERGRDARRRGEDEAGTILLRRAAERFADLACGARAAEIAVEIAGSAQVSVRPV